jgi:hypothetical protein
VKGGDPPFDHDFIGRAAIRTQSTVTLRSVRKALRVRHPPERFAASRMI